jgi:hypothetical protein
LLGAAFFLCIPALVLWGIADTSSECDLPIKDLNDKRLADPSDTTHLAIFKLETMLRQLNKNQGLGFVLFGIVLDKRYFFGLLVKLGAVTMTVLATIKATQTNGSSSKSCGLSKDEQMAFQSTARLINATCTWNLTTSAASVIVN